MSGPLDALRGSDAVLAAARATTALLEHRSVGERWEQPSALADMSVGALVTHLVGQLVMVADALEADEPDADVERVDVEEHYRRSEWLRAGKDDEANVSVRETAQERAASGHEAVLARWHGALARLTPWPEDAPTHAKLSFWRWCTTTEELALTRAMEIVVHGDDVAASLDLPAPELPRTASEPVLRLLAVMATDQHGTSALVRALSRAERSPASVSAL